ncbi:hypothetical protein [Mesorhizobium sp.]|uniref:restriction endonuclease-related protein n=1 Tax=Mesorhizobium sp. TaxID=1871066 RepID=UPI0025D632D9|nr:hypothetical protein [Mesorhizobium sp.]
MPETLRRGMALVSAIALRDGYEQDIGAQVNSFTAMACLPVGEWGPIAFARCDERAAILVDPGYGTPTEDCLQLANIGDESGIAEDIFHERLRTALSAVGAAAPQLYRLVRENIVRQPCRRRSEVLAFAQEVPELAGDLPSFFRPLPASALHGRTLRICGHCSSPLIPVSDRVSYPLGRCAVRECRMSWPEAIVGDQHEVAAPNEWRVADPAIMTYWVGPGLPEISLYDFLRPRRPDVELYPMCDAADISIGGIEVGIDVKSYSSAAVIGERFARGIGGLAAFRRRIVAIPDFLIRIDRDYVRTASLVSGCPEGIEFMSVGDVMTEFGV